MRTDFLHRSFDRLGNGRSGAFGGGTDLAVTTTQAKGDRELVRECIDLGLNGGGTGKVVELLRFRELIL
jgi:hypothetical protein